MDKLWEYFLKTHQADYCWWAWGKKKPWCYLYWLRGRVLFFFFGRAERYYTALRVENDKRARLYKELQTLRRIISDMGADDIEYLQAYAGQTEEVVVENNVQSEYFGMSDEDFEKLKDSGHMD